MLKISKLTDYALVIMSFLALDPKKILSATYIAKEIHLGVPTVSKILKILSDANLVKSYRGTVGGYQIAHLASEISIAKIVSAVEGNLAMTECCATESVCALDSTCSIKENWRIINNIIIHALSKISLQDMTCSLTEQGFSIKVESVKYVK